MAPGQYVVQAYRGGVNGSTEGAFAALAVAVVDRDVEGLRVQTLTGSSISGRVVAESFDGATPPDLTRIQIVPQAADVDQAPPGAPPKSEIAPDGRFLVSGIHGPRRLQVRRLPPRGRSQRTASRAWTSRTGRCCEARLSSPSTMWTSS